MEKVVGYWIEGLKEVPIVLKDDGKYYRNNEEFEKKLFQSALGEVWHDELWFSDQHELSYYWDIYDGVSCRIIGIGNTILKAAKDCISNIIDIMSEQKQNFINRKD